MSGKKKSKQEDYGWQVFRKRGASTVSLGIVYAADESEAIQKAAEQYNMPEALQSRLVARPWLA